MTSLYQLSVPVYVRYIERMSVWLKKAEEYCEEKGISKDEMVDWRLHEDMKPLAYQATAVYNASRPALEAVAGLPAAPVNVELKTVAQVHAHLAKAAEILQAADPACMDGKEEASIVMTSPSGMRFPFDSARMYLLMYANPNVFFHVVTFYDILRNHGVPLGKMDYLGGFLSRCEDACRLLLSLGRPQRI